MTQAHLHVLQDKAPIDKTAKIRLFGELIDQGDIPDPYYDDLPAFEHVYHLLQQGCRMLISRYKRALENHILNKYRDMNALHCITMG